MGSGYILTLLPVSSRVSIVSAATLSTMWMLSAGIGNILPPLFQSDPRCPPTSPLWPRAVLLYGFLAYMIATRLKQDAALRRMFGLQNALVAGKARLEAQAASLMQIIRRSFPPHVLAFCISIASTEHRTKSNGRVGAVDSLLEVGCISIVLQCKRGRAPTSVAFRRDILAMCPSQLLLTCCSTCVDFLRKVVSKEDIAAISEGLQPQILVSLHISSQISYSRFELSLYFAVGANSTSNLLQHVPHVSILCVDLVCLKILSGLLQADDTLAVLAFLVSVIDASVAASQGRRLHVVGSMYFAVFGAYLSGIL